MIITDIILSLLSCIVLFVFIWILIDINLLDEHNDPDDYF